MQNGTQITVMWSKSQREEEFRYGGRWFSKQEILITQTWSEL